MTIFADASALFAIITGEDGADALADAMDTDQRRLCFAVSVLETMAGLCRSYAFPIPAAHARVKLFLDAGRFQFVDIGKSEWVIASEAYARFGKGRHPAALNMGDCFAYACTNGPGYVRIGGGGSKRADRTHP